VSEPPQNAAEMSERKYRMYQVRTAAKVPPEAQQSDCCERPPVLRVRAEHGRTPILPHVYIVCDDPEHWLWAFNCCQSVVDAELGL